MPKASSILYFTRQSLPKFTIKWNRHSWSSKSLLPFSCGFSFGCWVIMLASPQIDGAYCTISWWVWNIVFLKSHGASSRVFCLPGDTWQYLEACWSSHVCVCIAEKGLVYCYQMSRAQSFCKYFCNLQVRSWILTQKVNSGVNMPSQRPEG